MSKNMVRQQVEAYLALPTTPPATATEAQKLGQMEESLMTFTSGKHKGKSFAEVEATDPGYSKWTLQHRAQAQANFVVHLEKSIQAGWKQTPTTLVEGSTAVRPAAKAAAAPDTPPDAYVPRSESTLQLCTNVDNLRQAHRDLVARLNTIEQQIEFVTQSSLTVQRGHVEASTRMQSQMQMTQAQMEQIQANFQSIENGMGMIVSRVNALEQTQNQTA